MAQKTKRIRRATLRGWWKIIPYLLCPVILLMIFAYLEAERLQNQYQRSDQVESIQELRKEIARLRDQDRGLNRIEVMDQKAPGWGLGEPDPDQIVIVSSDSIKKAMSKIRTHQVNHRTEELPTRTVLLHITYEDEIHAEVPKPVQSDADERERMAYETEKTD